MSDREKLIALIFNGQRLCTNSLCHGCEQLADHLIANGVVVREWIPVPEQLPEDGGAVLVCVDHKDIYTAEFRKNGDYWWFHIVGRKNCKVTHWMPLPEPPEES